MTLLLWSLAWVGWSCLMHRAGRLYERSGVPVKAEPMPPVGRVAPRQGNNVVWRADDRSGVTIYHAEFDHPVPNHPGYAYKARGVRLVGSPDQIVDALHAICRFSGGRLS